MKILNPKSIILCLWALWALVFVSCQNSPNAVSAQKSVVKDSIKTKPAAVQTMDTNPVLNKDKADIVEQIVTTSPTFLKMTKGLTERVVKNGGTSFGISLENNSESQPEDATSYIFELHETYPDRHVTIARFSFDPKKKQLYLYDAVEDDWLAIDFDKKWFVEFEGH